MVRILLNGAPREVAEDLSVGALLDAEGYAQRRVAVEVNREIVPKSPRDAQELGIGMVYQHFTLVPNMTVAENLVLSRPRLPFLLDWPKEHRDLADFMKGMPFQVDLRSPVRSLAAGEKQKVEILKQLYLKSRIIILDEPTSVLTPAEADEVLGLMHEMAKAGQVSLIIITHKFREVI